MGFKPLYPNSSLKKQVRPIEKTQSMWKVIYERFFGGK